MTVGTSCSIQVFAFIFINSSILKIKDLIFIADTGLWMVGSDYTRASGWIQSAQKGLLHLPTTGWQIGESSAANYSQHVCRYV